MNVIVTRATTARGCIQVKAKSKGRAPTIGEYKSKTWMGVASGGNRKAENLSKPAAIAATEAGRATIECIQPKKKPQTLPSPRPRELYSPPASAMEEPKYI